MRKILFYETLSGEKPIEKFLNNLSSKEAKKVVWVLKIIEDLPNVPTKFFKKLTNSNDIWEVRVRYSSNIYRLLGFFHKDRLIILNHAFQKKSQKTPKSEIKIAEKRKKEFLKGEKYERIK